MHRKMIAILAAAALFAAPQMPCMAEEYESYEAFTETEDGQSTEITSDFMENLVLSLIPEDGISIGYSTYYKDDIREFLTEIRDNPDDFIHKDHTCALSRIPEDERETLIRIIREFMGY